LEINWKPRRENGPRARVKDIFKAQLSTGKDRGQPSGQGKGESFRRCKAKSTPPETQHVGSLYIKGGEKN